MSALLGLLPVLATIVMAVKPSLHYDALPIVDLGYQQHQAISLESGVYNFSNIRYAAAPVGTLRFRPPTAPTVNATNIDTGDVGRMCPQAAPVWLTAIAEPFVADYLNGDQFNGSLNISSYGYTPLPLDPRTTEDCLFLDILTPQGVFDQRTGASVLVWIYGGGYTSGDKSEFEGVSLVTRSMAKGGDGIIYVAINYRLGAFGWLAHQNGSANMGLQDQRYALEWVRSHIHLFGGDPDQITVIGESAGGGSILHQITAYGGRGGPPSFHRAVLQSPAWVPIPTLADQAPVTRQFFQLLGVDTLEEAQQLPSSSLIAANTYQIGTQASYGQFLYGPVVDGCFVPKLPGQLLLEGGFHTNISVIVGHNRDEGLAFTSPITNSSQGFQGFVQQFLPILSTDQVDYVVNILYPPEYDGSHPYLDSIQRGALFLGDVVVQCNTDFVNRAFNYQTHTYEFDIYPALHGQDISYTFFNGSSASVVNDTVAYVMQDWFISFAESGTPESLLGPQFPTEGPTLRLLELGQSSITTVTDTTANARCRWWQTAFD